MIRQSVASSSIKSVGHEGDVLEVEFASGTIYRYSGVPREEFDQLLGAESVGKHFAAAIRGAGFAVEKVDPAADAKADA